jgi:hypothetical protein
MRVLNEVGAIRLQGKELALDTQCNFDRVLECLEAGLHKDALVTCQSMDVRSME